MARETTITLDPDVAERVAHEAERTGAAPDTLVNEALRRTLRDAAIATPFTVRARDLGTRAGVNFDCAWKLADAIDRRSDR